MTDQDERLGQPGLQAGLGIDLQVIPDEDDLEPMSLVYDDEDRGRNDEPVSGQMEPDDPDDRVSREGPFDLPGEGER